jgi:hypothetical protein
LKPSITLVTDPRPEDKFHKKNITGIVMLMEPILFFADLMKKEI